MACLSGFAHDELNAWARCSVFALVPDLFFLNLFLNRRKIAQNKFAKHIRYCERENWVSALRALTYYNIELIVLLHFVSITCTRRVSVNVRVSTIASIPSSWMATRFHWICNAAMHWHDICLRQLASHSVCESTPTICADGAVNAFSVVSFVMALSLHLMAFEDLNWNTF